ncbi:MAG: hypothetical protein U0670_22305 [Anaerolineae bacterium]
MPSHQRTAHTSVAMMVGAGFTHHLKTSEPVALRDRFIALRTDVDLTVELFKSLKFLQFERETEYVALHKDDEYRFIDGVIGSTDGESLPI